MSPFNDCSGDGSTSFSSSDATTSGLSSLLVSDIAVEDSGRERKLTVSCCPKACEAVDSLKSIPPPTPPPSSDIDDMPRDIKLTFSCWLNACDAVDILKSLILRC